MTISLHQVASKQNISGPLGLISNDKNEKENIQVYVWTDYGIRTELNYFELFWSNV